MSIDAVINEARAIARRRLSGYSLIVALKCLSDENVMLIAERRLNGDPLGKAEALRVLVMLCIDPQTVKGNDKLE